MAAAGYRSRTGNFKKGLQQLVDNRLVELSIPDKPRSRLQKYRLSQRERVNPTGVLSALAEVIEGEGEKQKITASAARIEGVTAGALVRLTSKARRVLPRTISMSSSAPVWVAQKGASGFSVGFPVDEWRW